MHLDFLTPRVDLLNSSGALKTIHRGGFVGQFRPSVILLARDLTTFSYFDASSLPRSRRAPAAALHARTGSPYLNSGSMSVKSGSSYGIWWWDLDRFQSLVEIRDGGGRPVIRPETLGQPTGDGWRIVRLDLGYEAQLWVEGRLKASAWRLERFTVGAWEAFSRLQRGEADSPSMPTVQSLPLSFSAPAFALSPNDLSREQLAGVIVGVVAFTCLSLAVLFMGQGSRLAEESKAIEAQAAVIQGATPRSSGTNDLEHDRRKLIAFAEIENRTSPLSAMGAAISIASYHDISPTSLEAEQGSLTMTLPYSSVNLADVLIADLEQSGYFYDVRPKTDAANQRLVIEMKTKDGAEPLSVDG